MADFLRFIIFSVAMLSIGWPPQSNAQSSDPANWRSFHMSSIETQLADYAEVEWFLIEPGIQAGTLTDKSDLPHHLGMDAVYLFREAAGHIAIAGESFDLNAGSMIFVRGDVERRVRTDHAHGVLVIAVNATSSLQDPEWTVSSLGEVRNQSENDRNVWNRFFDFESLNLGIYMLPQSVGGDSALTHQVEEINFVTKGEAIFRVNEDEMSVTPGSVVWVDTGNPHYFHSLSSDFDVLILFHQKPGVQTP